MRDHAQNSFVTGLLGRLEPDRGVLGLVNAGYVLPILMRGASIAPVELVVDRPFGQNCDRA